jgi:AbrB family looped-hinge helix DNA binding protein
MTGLVDGLTFNDIEIDHAIVEGGPMSVVKVSSKYQIVIPKEVREATGIRAGAKMRVLRYGNGVVVLPVRPMREVRGSLPGIDTTVPRDPDRV